MSGEVDDTGEVVPDGKTLLLYVAMENAMLAAHEAGDEGIENNIADMMDAVWKKLSAGEIHWLTARGRR